MDPGEKKILVDQDSVNDDIEIIAAPESHRKTYEHASLGLAPATPDPVPAQDFPRRHRSQRIICERKILTLVVRQFDLLDGGATGRGTPRPVLLGRPKAQVSEYRDLWHLTINSN